MALDRAPTGRLGPTPAPHPWNKADAKIRKFLPLAAFLLLAGCACPPPPPSGPVVRANGATLRVEIVSTPETRARGLSNRDALGADKGMLFVFEETRPVSFWMKDTRIPLSIAFLDESGRVLAIEDMAPLDETLHPSPAPVRYAIEANKGWFERNGIRAGDKFELP